MDVLNRQPLPGTTAEIRSGRSSWDISDYSVKFAYQDKRGHVARQGEIPCDMAVPMALHVLDQYPTEVSTADLKRLYNKAKKMLGVTP